MTAKAAIDNNILCGMCGEAAGVPALIPVLAGMGIKEFSMSSHLILQARKTLSSYTMEQCCASAKAVLELTTAGDVREYLQFGSEYEKSGNQVIGS
jgi:phosphotransferase system enzyme I (PtsI)